MLIVVLVVTVLFVLFLRTNPTGREFFVPAGTLIGVKLLNHCGSAMSCGVITNGLTVQNSRVVVLVTPMPARNASTPPVQ